MNKKLEDAMKKDWVKWHEFLDPEEIPDEQPSYKRGFNAACDALLPLLKECLPYVQAQSAEDHKLDGLFNTSMYSSDDLLVKIKEILKI